MGGKKRDESKVMKRKEEEMKQWMRGFQLEEAEGRCSVIARHLRRFNGGESGT